MSIGDIAALVFIAWALHDIWVYYFDREEEE